jgi:DNA-directed RNA polymerase specialized sigma24 family protein
MKPEGNVSQWLDQLRDGDPEAAERLWEAYFPRLAGLARLKLRGTSTAAADAEDVALSAFASFFRGVERGRFPRLNDRDNLWRLLVVLTVRKAAHQVRDAGRVKRGGAAVVGNEALDQVVGPEPSPAFAAEVAEECRRLLTALADPDLETIALWKMEGYTNDEIAARLGCAVRTAERKLRLIRAVWEKETDHV